jgi:hypothetical protein
MAAGDSIVSICNEALTLLGEAPITALTDATKAARLCQDRYDPTRRRMLSLHPWLFAGARVELDEASPVPAFGYLRAFDLPADYRRVIAVHSDNPNLRWTIEGNRILSDVSAPMQLHYVKDEDDPVMFSPAFVSVLAAALAAEICVALTGSTDRRADMRNELRDRMQSGRIAGQPDAFDGDWAQETWLSARMA